MEKKFQMLKEQFKASSIQSYPMYSLDAKFVLTTDYSKENLGAVLSKEQEGMERMMLVCRALKYLQTLRDPRKLTARWLHLIQTYDFQVVHSPANRI